jgi:hypothetical protein
VEFVENKRVEFLIVARNDKRVCIRMKTMGMSRVAEGCGMASDCGESLVLAGVQIGQHQRV